MCRILDPRSRILQDPGYRILEFGCWILDLGSRVLDPVIVYPGSRILDPGSRVQDPISRWARITHYPHYQDVPALPASRIILLNVVMVYGQTDGLSVPSDGMNILRDPGMQDTGHPSCDATVTATYRDWFILRRSSFAPSVASRQSPACSTAGRTDTRTGRFKVHAR